MRKTLWLAAGLAVCGISCGRKPMRTKVPIPARRTVQDAIHKPAAPHSAPPQSTAAREVEPRPAEEVEPPAPTGQEHRRITIRDAQSALGDAFFDYDQYSLREDARTALQTNARILREVLGHHPGIAILIEGHADERGSAEYNLALADRRARAAVEYLSVLGIPVGVLRPVSYGREKPQCFEASEDCWQRNRRAHIVLTPGATE